MEERLKQILNLVNTIYAPTSAETKADALTELDELDVTNDKDYSRFKEILASIKNDFAKLNPFFSKLVDGILADIIAVAEDIRSLNETSEHAEEPTGEIPVRPSTNVSREMQDKIANLTDEYIKTVIAPTGVLNDESLADATDALYEFACWIYSR